MFGRRIAILVAVLMGLTALAASLAPPPQPARHDAARTPTPTTAGAGAEPGTASPGVVSRRLEIGPPGGPLAHVRARAGQTVELDVSGDVVDAVVVVGFPDVAPIDPDTPAHLQIETDKPGSFPIRLQDDHRDVGVLDVSANR